MYPAGESLTVSIFLNALLPVLYCAIFSTGIAFTFQILGQKGVPPTEASLICSLEMVFGLIAGCLFLGETLTSSEILGAVLMSVGIVSAQLSIVLFIQERLSVNSSSFLVNLTGPTAFSILVAVLTRSVSSVG